MTDFDIQVTDAEVGRCGKAVVLPVQLAVGQGNTVDVPAEFGAVVLWFTCSGGGFFGFLFALSIGLHQIDGAILATTDTAIQAAQSDAVDRERAFGQAETDVAHRKGGQFGERCVRVRQACTDVLDAQFAVTCLEIKLLTAVHGVVRFQGQAAVIHYIGGVLFGEMPERGIGDIGQFNAAVRAERAQCHRAFPLYLLLVDRGRQLVVAVFAAIIESSEVVQVQVEGLNIEGLIFVSTEIPEPDVAFL